MKSPLHVEAYPKYSLLGFPVNALTKADLLNLVGDAVQGNKRYVIGNHNMHGLYLSFNDIRMREFLGRADYVHLDGMALVLVGRLLGLPLSRKDRTTYVDFLPAIVKRAAEEGWRISYLGSKPGVAERGAEILRAQYPSLQIQTQHGYFDSRTSSGENQRVLENIRNYRPHVLLVGMGMPRQEHWVADNIGQIEANSVFCCGAMMDYATGEIPTPPRWIGQIGLEWLYRLIAEPGRLWRRYLVEPWFVLKMVAKELLSPSRRKAASARGDISVS
jgi:N-acetylglucosaminyldiphosphoundecaprenol N-acetyl-beta-D-mannosaminyltransferase